MPHESLGLSNGCPRLSFAVGWMYGLKQTWQINFIHCYNYLQLLDDTVYYLFSDGYTTDEIIYRWQTSNKSGVEIYDDVTLSQFDIVSIWTANNTYSNALGKYFIIFVVSSNKMS